MYARYVLLALSVLLLATPAFSQSHAGRAASASGIESTAWLLKYQGKSTNEFIWDHRAKRLVSMLVPAMLSPDLLNALGGPPDPVFVVSKRYVSMSACRAHSCMEKGFLWVDTQTGIGLGAYHVTDTLLLGSNGMSANNIPQPARLALTAWLTEHDLRTESVEFMNPGARIKLKSSDFKAQDKFQAPSTGPAFDCKLAASEIEKTICTDKKLSAQDLALSELYTMIRQGSSTTIAQEQLRDLQRKWLKERNRECSDPTGMVACLKDKYNAQYDRLRNWIPTIPHMP